MNEKKKKTLDRVEKVMRYTFTSLALLTIVYNFSRGVKSIYQWEHIFASFFTVVLFLLPTIFSKRTKIQIPALFQITFLLFILASMYLGEMQEFFRRFAWWDSMLHFYSGMMICYIGFILIYVLNREKNIHMQLSPFFIALFAFCFASAVGVFWEIFEYFMDGVFGLDMQKARNLVYLSDGVHPACNSALGIMCDTRLGVIDTMKDLMENTLGALVVSFIGYFYLKKRMINNNLFWKIKEQFIEENPKLFNNE
jgi:hypothetical protein